MAEISTPILNPAQSDATQQSSPRAITLAIIRQFARAYTPSGLAFS
ncbi:MAG: hypothetical protein K2M40_02440 [Muribaculaceae bacterium]|nr:hypothetical protein [Bacteroidales bacterium]MBD5325975.1 hypothetical protein [Bacteroides sp.]MDE6222758.1 hypothetical protein [Muribaculaceae bacterium]MBD5187984.1 hypothetical protein [Bacteroidales bacterium]MBD5327266.1 hypothetical protein [Bacteroides sp.]